MSLALSMVPGDKDENHKVLCHKQAYPPVRQTSRQSTREHYRRAKIQLRPGHLEALERANLPSWALCLFLLPLQVSCVSRAQFH